MASSSLDRRWTLPGALLATLVLAPGFGSAQTKAPAQVVKPPVAQAWIDVATFAGMGVPDMGGGSGSPMSMLGGVFGGGAGGAGAKNSFGMTQTGSAGRWVDVTLHTSRNPALQTATQSVPAATQLAPSLALVAPKVQTPAPAVDDERVIEREIERPKGRLSVYWGCGETVRAGQPRVLDMASAKPEDFQKFFVSRRATQRGAHVAAGRPLWPNETDARMVPANASLVGEHAFSGQGVPDGFRFALPAAQDLMPAIELRQTDAGGATQLEWAALPTARAVFIAAMGARGGSDLDMVFWSSSEVPELGMGLIDYQTNAAVDRWLNEKVLLAPGVTRCTVPKGIFGDGGGAMLRMIAYGSELNLAFPPRPADPKIAWEPQWAVKVRIKSVANAFLGMDMAALKRGAAPAAPDPAPAQPATKPEEEKKINPVDLLRGILGR